MQHLDAEAHTRGRSSYVDDVRPPAGMLHAAVVPSPLGHGDLRRVDVEAARAAAGVFAVLTASDVPGENQIGPVIQDEELLASNQVHFVGQPVALVVAESAAQARHAAQLAVLEIDPLPVITNPRQAFEAGEVIGEPKLMQTGDVDAAWQQCHLVVEGECDLGGQEHVYLETQRARAEPLEDGSLRVSTSTQSPYAAQRAIGKVLALDLHQVEVDVKRLGGGFGGKEDQATPWACLAALAAAHTGQPVELVLSRAEDLMMTGKRHPYLAEFKIGVAGDGQILAFEAKYFQNSGAACDLSLAVLARTLFHSTNAYAIANVRVFAACCRTNLPPNTAFRGFGGPQGMFVMESALARAAEALGLPREELQEKNLLREGDSFPYGQIAEQCRIRRCWSEAVESFDLAAVRQRVTAFNEENFAVKKGYAVMPIAFGISFTATFMNQASALLHIYTDGSLSLSTGGVEMGQGLSTNLAVVAARTLGIDASRVRVESTNTRRIANMSPSAASATTLLNGNATLGAARRLLESLLTQVASELEVARDRLTLVDEVVCLDGEPTDWHWQRVVLAAYHARVALSAHEFYATPDLWFDEQRQHGRPFAYHVYGVAVVEATVDCLRGTYDLDSVRIVHDLGRTLNHRVDLGQVEGGLAQGLGWMTLEDLRFDDQGRPMSGALATYKVPDVYFMPEDLEVRFLENVGNDLGPYHSKAVGEPPLMYGIGAFFALRHAIRAFRPGAELPFAAPLTPERVLMQLHADDTVPQSTAAKAALSVG